MAKLINSAATGINSTISVFDSKELCDELLQDAILHLTFCKDENCAKCNLIRYFACKYQHLQNGD